MSALMWPGIITLGLAAATVAVVAILAHRRKTGEDVWADDWQWRA